MEKVTNEEMVQSMNKMIDHWRTQDYLLDKDFLDLEIIRNFLKEGKLEQAGDKIFYLDTLVREVIPDLVYDYLEELGFI